MKRKRGSRMTIVFNYFGKGGSVHAESLPSWMDFLRCVILVCNERACGEKTE
jgi:hypothetical protein